MQLSNIENNWWMSDCCTSAAHFFLLQMGPNISREKYFKLLFFGEEASHLVVHLGKICGKELKDEGEGGLGVDDVVQGHNVCVAQVLQQARLSGRS